METLAIFSGGKFAHMGQDKALMPFLGRPLILRLVERLAGVAEQTILLVNQPADYTFLELPIYPNLLPDCNALGGLYTALHVAGHSIIAAVACDMPFASPAMLKYERLLLSQSGADVVIPSTPQGWEPLHAVYRRETCLPVIQAAIEAGQFKLTGWLAQVNVRMLLPEETARFDPNGLAFWNLNTPEDFHEAEERARVDEV